MSILSKSVEKERPRYSKFIMFLLFLTFTNVDISFGFDCQKAQTSTEKAICASKELVRLDSDLNKIYSEIISSSKLKNRKKARPELDIKNKSNLDSPAGDRDETTINTKIDEIKKTQKQWLKTYPKKCQADTTCITLEIQNRISVLKEVKLDNSSQSKIIPSNQKSIHPSIQSGIEIEKVLIKKKKPIDLDLEYPTFSGSNSSTVSILNKWVKAIWADDKGCAGDPESTKDQVVDNENLWNYQRSLSLVSLNENFAIFDHVSDYTCPGAAHPDNFKEQLVLELKTGKTFDIWERISETTRNILIDKISKFGKKTRANDECLAQYSLENLKGQKLKFSFNSTALLVEADFPHASQACVETMTILKSDATTLFAKESAVSTMLKNLP